MTTPLPPIPPAPSPADVIDQALDILETRGWCPNGPTGPNGEVCTAVAIGAVRGQYVSLDNPTPVFTVADEAINAAFHTVFELIDAEDGGAWSIGDWNDRPGRDFAHVRDLLKRARDKLVTDQ